MTDNNNTVDIHQAGEPVLPPIQWDGPTDDAEHSADAFEGLWTADGEVEDLEAPLENVGVVCPNPTKWAFQRAWLTNSNMQRISNIVSAAAVPITVTVSVLRTITFTAGITAGYKAGIGVIEAEAKISLQTSVSIQQGTAYRITVPTGRRIALYGGSTYINRIFARTVYESAGPCNPVRQVTTVSSPSTPIIESRFV